MQRRGEEEEQGHAKRRMQRMANAQAQEAELKAKAQRILDGTDPAWANLPTSIRLVFLQPSQRTESNRTNETVPFLKQRPSVERHVCATESYTF